MPETLSLFNSDKTSSLLLFLTRSWDVVAHLLSLPNLMSGLGGLRAHMILGPQNTKCFRLCLLAIVEVVPLLQDACPEINRGDISALVSASSELLLAITTLCSSLLPSSLQIPIAVKYFLGFDFRLSSLDPADLLFPPKMSSFLTEEPLSHDVEFLFRKRLLAFISGLLIFFQEVITQWYNGGLALFDIFSVSCVRKFDIDSCESRFARFTSFFT